MIGIDASTGKALGGIAHLRQSIRDILTTKKGTRIGRRDYGSDVPDLVDAPTNPSTLLAIYTATADAIGKWETRFKASAVSASSAEPGSVTLDITGEYLPDGRTVTISGIVVN